MILKAHLELIQKVIDTTIPLACAIAQSLLALGIAPPPQVLVDLFYTPTTAYLWTLLSFIFYLAIVIGVWLKPKSTDQNARGLYIYFQYPGLVGAAFVTLVYPVALAFKFGLLSASVVSIGFSGSIGLYFLFRFLKFHIIVAEAKKIFYTPGS